MGFNDPIKPAEEGDAQLPLLLKKIIEYDPATISLALGRLGERFRAFAESIDLSHPDAREVFIDFPDESSFYQDIDELLQLADYAKTKNLTRILPSMGSRLVSRSCSREKFYRTVLKSIDSPANNRTRIRLLKTREERDRVRSQKRMQVIDLGALQKRGEELWNTQPDSFFNFARYNTSYQQEIAIADKKAKRYLELGCRKLSRYVADNIAAMKSQYHDVYYGFNRITMTNAAVVLAKSLKYILSTYWPKGDLGDKIYTIKIPGGTYGGYNFTGNHWRELELLKQNFKYEPRVYPLHAFWHKAPDNVKRIVDHLEAFPEAQGKAIFDNYAMVVPGPQCESSFVAPDGGEWSFADREAAMTALDNVLVEKGHITPIVLGEKDGKCYFICLYL